MANEQDVNLAKSGQYRVFVQPDGSSPENPYLYVGCLSLGGLQEDLGTGEPIYCPSSEVPARSILWTRPVRRPACQQRISPST